MKKLLLLIICITASYTFAQRNTASIKLGPFVPSSGAGFIVGYEGTKLMDPNFSIGWSIDWYHSNYTDKKLVEDYNNIYGIGRGEINELRAKTNLHDFPLMGTFTGSFLVAPFYRFYITAALGGELLIINYSNFENPDQSETTAAMGFNWRFGVGGIYEMSKRTDVFIELGYHNASPSWDYEVDNPNGLGKRTYERTFDMSGFMARVGFKFYY